MSTVLSSALKSHTVLICPVLDMNHAFIQHVHTVYSTYPLVI
jgi:hypothetical protein